MRRSVGSHPATPLAGALAGLLAIGAAPLALTLAPVAGAATISDDVVISEVYGDGGNAGAAYNHDYVELENPTDAAVSLDGWTLQYAAKAGTNWSGSVALSGDVPAGGTYLVQLATDDGSIGNALPEADATGGTNMAIASGSVALVSSGAKLTCTLAACADPSEAPTVVDLVGYGEGKAYSGSAAAPAGSKTQSLSRTANTGENSTDFALADFTPTPSGADPADPTDPEDPEEPGQPADCPEDPVAIADVQGTGDATPLAGCDVTTEGVVTAVYADGGLNGFVIETPNERQEGDGASDAIFVYAPADADSVTAGESVRVSGEAGEYYGLTQISLASGGLETVGSLGAIEPLQLRDVPTDDATLEAMESMLVTPAAGSLTVTDVYDTYKYGEVTLARGAEPLTQPGQIMRPGQDATAMYKENLASTILLDDGRTTDFSKNTGEPVSYLSLDEPVRVGSHPAFDEPVVLSYGHDTWRFQPTSPWSGIDDGVTFQDTRTEKPADVGGDLRLGTFNVLNYFTTLGAVTDGCTAYEDRTGDGNNVKGGCDVRGAWDEDDFTRQQDKIVAAIGGTDTDVLGLMEIENSARLGEEPDEATADLVDALNAAEGAPAQDATGQDAVAGNVAAGDAAPWAYVATGPAYEKLGLDGGQDAISNALIYRTDAVRPVGDPVILAGDAAFTNAREPIGQVFQPLDENGADAGEPFLFVVNHLKSKGSADGHEEGDDPVVGNSNYSRVQQATALADWVGRQQEATGVDDVFLGGDFNAYAQEDPLQVLYDAGYTDLGTADLGTGSNAGYSYVYDGMVGSLDHVVANASALARVTGADEWDINASESVMLQYSRYNNNVTDLYANDPYASSDHNPMIIGLKSGAATEPTDPEPTDPEPTDPEPIDPEPTDPAPSTPAEPTTPASPGRPSPGPTTIEVETGPEGSGRPVVSAERSRLPRTGIEIGGALLVAGLLIGTGIHLRRRARP